jgi:NitT/TauT family transport system substrate-binding protein
MSRVQWVSAAACCQHLVDKGYEKRYELALEVVKSAQYRQWRDFHPEDAVRLHASRLYDARLTKTNPRDLVSRDTDWRFPNQTKRELKV